MATHSKSTPRLGRGLSGLISTSIKPKAIEGEYVSQGQTAGGVTALPHPKTGGAVDLRIADIAPNPYQPRREFNSTDLAELSASIAQQGVIQPLIIANSPDPAAQQPYVLIAGERRLRAARQAGLTVVPCIIREASRQQMIEWALIENIQRIDLNPIERATAYQVYLDRFSLTHAAAAQRLGVPRTAVSNHLRLLALPYPVQLFIADGLLTFGHAKILAGLAEAPDRQQSLAERVITRRLSVRQLEELLIKQAAASKATPGKVPGDSSSKPPYVRDLEERLTQSVGTRVTIRPGRRKNTGKIILEYYTLDDFDRLGQALGLPTEP